MGLSTRIFIVDNDNRIHKLPLIRYKRLFDKNSKEYLPQFANQRVKYVLVVLDLINRKPVNILRSEYSFLNFDTKGKIIPSDPDRLARMASDLLKPIDLKSDNVIKAGHLFAQKRFKDEYTWQPSAEIEAAIKDKIFT